MPNFLTEFFNKELSPLKKIQSMDDLKSYIAEESTQKGKRKARNQKLKLLNFNETSYNEKLNDELFFLFTKIYNFNLTNKLKEGFILKVLKLYQEELTKEEIILFLSAFWHINGSTWLDFKFLFEIWLKFLHVDSIVISEKSIELIWFQDALLNVTTENKLTNFIYDLPSFIKLANFQSYPISESLQYINKQPDHVIEYQENNFLTERILNLLVKEFCKNTNVQLEKIYLELFGVLVDASNVIAIDFFTKNLRKNAKNWLRNDKLSSARFLYFILQIWQKRLISFSHFLEFVFQIGKIIPKLENNLYIDYVINMYYSSFLQLNHLLKLLNDRKILTLINNKNKSKIFEIFEANGEIFTDLQAIQFYIKLNKRLFSYRNNLGFYFDCIIGNQNTWHSFVTFLLDQTIENQKKFFSLFLIYFSSSYYNMNFNTIYEKFIDFQNKLTNILRYSNEEMKGYIFQKMTKTINEDERYLPLLPSFVLMTMDYVTTESTKNLIAEKFNQSIKTLNPLTINANYYRMFLRDSFRITFRKDINYTIQEAITTKLESFLESYMQYNNLLIADNEKIEFLEYLLTNEVAKQTSEKIFNWIKTKPNLNVKIITSLKHTMEERQERESNNQTQLVLKDIKCGSCLREITTIRDKKSCEICEITLCLTCFIEFEFSGENCPGSIFGNKVHKLKMRREYYNKEK